MRTAQSRSGSARPVRHQNGALNSGDTGTSEQHWGNAAGSRASVLAVGWIPRGRQIKLVRNVGVSLATAKKKASRVTQMGGGGSAAWGYEGSKAALDAPGNIPLQSAKRRVGLVKGRAIQLVLLVVKDCVRMQKLEQPSRRVMIVSTVVSGLFIVVGFMTAFYVSEHSLNVDIPIYKNGVVVRGQDKGEALFGPLLIQFLFFLVMVYHCLIWDRFVRRASERTAAINAQYSMQVDLARGLRNTCYAVIGMDVFIFSIVVYNSLRLLNV
jgi:hypothetical protein